jgi:hypothetical protein
MNFHFLNPYKFYKKGDKISCRRRLRVLKAGGSTRGGGGGSSGGGGGGSSTLNNPYLSTNEDSSSCTIPYS